MSLQELRKKIDDLDEQLLSLLFERMKISREMAEWKHQKNIPIYQPDREAELLQKRQKDAREKGLSKEFAKSLFEVIIRESRNIQEEIS